MIDNAGTLNYILNALLSAGIVIVAFLLILLLFYGLNYLKSHAKNALIKRLAEQAYAWAEKEGRGKLGDEKAIMAFTKLSEWLTARGFHISPEKITALVQLAWTKWEGVPKASKSTTSATVTTNLSDSNEVSEKIVRGLKEQVNEALES